VSGGALTTPQEAKTHTMEVNFDLLTLKCMLNYIYTNNYDRMPAQLIQRTVSDKTEEQAQQGMLGTICT
jgi:pyocin large subunit-like protein